MMLPYFNKILSVFDDNSFAEVDWYCCVNYVTKPPHFCRMSRMGVTPMTLSDH